VRVPWIRVHGGLYDKSVVDRLAVAAGICEHEAIGVLVTFWSGVAANAHNGSIAGASDAQLEKWAKWSMGRRRKVGLFAEWVRREHQDPEGRVPEWDDYAGALELRRAKEAQRLAEKRQRLRNSTQSVAQQTSDILQPLQPARANGTERDDTIPKPTPQKRVREKTALPDWVAALVAIWTAKVGKCEPKPMHAAVKEFVAEFGFDRVRAALEVYVSPDEGPANGKRKPAWFAENFHHYRELAETPFDDGQGVLTDRGRRFMAKRAS
jgi:hypothetical protein